MLVYLLIHEQRNEFLSEQDADEISLPSPATSWRALAVLTMMLLIAPKSFLPKKLSEPVALVAVAMLKSVQWVMVMELVSWPYSTRCVSLIACIGAQRILDPPDYNNDVRYQHNTNLLLASYNGESWICC